MEPNAAAPYQAYRRQGVVLAPGTARFVLVPGAGHPASCFDKVRELLERGGQTVHALTLPGVGDRATELTADTGLATHIDDVVRHLMDHNLRDVVLVGHSYAGMVITGVADREPDRIRHLVYLDAVEPAADQSMLDAQPLTLRAPAASTRAMRDGVEVTLLPGHDTIAFLGLTAPQDVEWARRSLTPHPWKTFTEPLRLRDPDVMTTVGSTKIYSERSARTAASHAATRGPRRHAWAVPAVHDLMLTEPDLVADMLLDAASRAEELDRVHR